MFGTVRFKNLIVVAGMRVILIQDEPNHRLQAGDIRVLLKENLEPGGDRGKLTETQAYPIHPALLREHLRPTGSTPAKILP